MRFCDSKSSGARWSEFAEEIFGTTWDVLWETADISYSGSAEVLAKKDGEDKYAVVSWYYGSCSYCDPWEDEPTEKAREEFNQLVSYFTGATLMNWIREAQSADTTQNYPPAKDKFNEWAKLLSTKCAA